MPAGGPQPPDYRPRPPAGPGKLTQRTDMSAPPAAQGVYIPTGLPYGQAGQLQQAMKAVPLPRGNAFTPQPPPQPGMPVPPPQGAPPANMAPPVQPAPPTAGMPDIHTLIGATPTRFPNEPVTAGLPVGPGPGPTPQVSPVGKVIAYLAGTPFATDAVKSLALQVDRPGVNF